MKKSKISEIAIKVDEIKVLAKSLNITFFIAYEDSKSGFIAMGNGPNYKNIGMLQTILKSLIDSTIVKSEAVL